jgi:hypothetical protein
VFVARQVAVPRSRLIEALQRPAEELRASVAAGAALLA